jgi:hypothetical protein
MATVTTQKQSTTSELKRAIDFNKGDVLVDKIGQVGIRTEKHIVRASEGHEFRDSLFVMELHRSRDLFTLAPPGTSFTVSN